MLAEYLRRTAVGLIAALVFAVALVAPAVAAAHPPNTALTSTEGILTWINGYRGRPDPEGLPPVVQALSRLQAFKDAGSAGAYVGFIAGMIGANPKRADRLIDKMLAI